jgi:hypothetical protein
MTTSGDPTDQVSRSGERKRDLARTTVAGLIAAVPVGWGSDNRVEFAVTVACCLAFLFYGYRIGTRP